MLSDFNCKIFNFDRLKFLNSYDYSSDSIISKIESDLNALDSLGFHRLVCQVLHDENFSINRTLEKIDNLERFIKQSVKPSLRRKFNISVLPSVHLSENAPFIKNISALSSCDTNYFFAVLPISVAYPDYLDATINKILYNCRLRPIFTEFETFATTHNDTEYIEKMINIKNSAFIFSLNSNNFPKCIGIIRCIYENGNTVLFSTGCEHDLFNVKRITQNISLLKEKLPEGIYLDIMIKAHRFLR